MDVGNVTCAHVAVHACKAVVGGVHYATFVVEAFHKVVAVVVAREEKRRRYACRAERRVVAALDGFVVAVAELVGKHCGNEYALVVWFLLRGGALGKNVVGDVGALVFAMQVQVVAETDTVDVYHEQRFRQLFVVHCRHVGVGADKPLFLSTERHKHKVVWQFGGRPRGGNALQSQIHCGNTAGVVSCALAVGYGVVMRANHYLFAVGHGRLQLDNHVDRAKIVVTCVGDGDGNVGVGR